MLPTSNASRISSSSPVRTGRRYHRFQATLRASYLGSSPVGGEILRQALGRLEPRRMHAAMANDTSVSEFCTEQGIWASIKPLTLRLYVNPEGQLRAQGCARSSWAADGRHSWLAALRRHKSQFGMQIRSSGDRTDRQIAYRRISPPTGLDPGFDAGKRNPGPLAGAAAGTIVVFPPSARTGAETG